MDVVRREYINITNSGGTDYTSAGDQKAILVYAKRRTSENSGKEYPYTWWDDDIHGGSTPEDALVGGGVTEAELTYVSNGMWYYEINTATLRADNEDREDFYFVKTGTATEYIGPDDSEWEIVQGCDPKPIITQYMEAYKMKALQEAVNAAGAVIADQLVTTFALNMTNLPTGLNITAAAIKDAIKNDDTALVALAAVLAEDRTFVTGVSAHIETS